jgi:hypothetical protein
MRSDSQATRGAVCVAVADDAQRLLRLCGAPLLTRERDAQRRVMDAIAAATR